jgi:DNA-binding NarL/FixJ family response regulator
LTADGGEDAARAVIVMDDPISVRAVRRLLDANGADVVGVVDRGIDAVAVSAQHRANLVVLDISLAGGLGLRLLSVLRAARPEVRIVVLTPFRTLDVAAVEAGADAVLEIDDLSGLREELHRLLHGPSSSGDTELRSTPSATAG